MEIVPLTGIGEVTPGDDLASLLSCALARVGLVVGAGDVLVVTQKIVSKAQGMFVDLAEVKPSAEADRVAALTGKDPRLVELVLRESGAVLRAVPNVLISRHRLGHVMANAGIDRSNIGPGNGERALLLPANPDGVARSLADALGVGAVVISDSFGRPWRYGVVNVAIGAAGLPALRDDRGRLDRDGRRLEVTQVAIADMVASAAGLVGGEGAESVPAALIRGLDLSGPERPAAALVRPLSEDLFQ